MRFHIRLNADQLEWSAMADFASLIATYGDLSEEDQKKAGKVAAGSLNEKEKEFLKTVGALIESGEIDVYKPQTFVKKDVYDKLDERWQDKTDLALVNIANLLQHIYEFWKSKDTPDESQQLEDMIRELWIMKERAEEHHDVFKF